MIQGLSWSSKKYVSRGCSYPKVCLESEPLFYLHGYWPEASALCWLLAKGFSSSPLGLLEWSHNMAVGFPQNKWFERKPNKYLLWYKQVIKSRPYPRWGQLTSTTDKLFSIATDSDWKSDFTTWPLCDLCLYNGTNFLTNEWQQKIQFVWLVGLLFCLLLSSTQLGKNWGEKIS